MVGCLLRLNDHRRLEDGRLVLLVHPVERFVVERRVQDFPYSVADEQILPDVGEAGPGAADENCAGIARAAAVVKSLEYHDYEYDSTLALPLSRKWSICRPRACRPPQWGKYYPSPSSAIRPCAAISPLRESVRRPLGRQV